jgi:hypothetical protein
MYSVWGKYFCKIIFIQTNVESLHASLTVEQNTVDHGQPEARGHERVREADHGGRADHRRHLAAGAAERTAA